MKMKVYFGIAIRIVMLFSMGMLVSLASPMLHDFFGDVKLKKVVHGAFINDGYDWSASHYWFFWMCVVLFLLSVINVIVSIVRLLRKNYDTSKWMF